jgi:hypothetical protein
MRNWVNLTEKELEDLYEVALLFGRGASDKDFWAITFGKAIELVIKEKNESLLG